MQADSRSSAPCKHMADDGHCPYGARCRFSHHSMDPEGDALVTTAVDIARWHLRHMRDAAEDAAQEALDHWLDANIPAEQRSAAQGGGYADYAAAIDATPGLSVAPRPGGLPRLEMAAGGPPAEWCAGRDRNRGYGARAGGGGFGYGWFGQHGEGLTVGQPTRRGRTRRRRTRRRRSWSGPPAPGSGQ